MTTCYCGKAALVECKRCEFEIFCSDAHVKEYKRKHKIQCDVRVSELAGLKMKAPKIVCGGCGGEAKNKCARCGTVYYCSKECQKNHWKTHKITCGKSGKATPQVQKKNQLEGCANVLLAIKNGTCGSEMRKIFGDKEVKDATERDRRIHTRHGAILADNHLNRRAPLASNDMYMKLKKEVIKALNGKIDWLREGMVEEMVRDKKETAHRYILMYMYSSSDELSMACNSPWCTGILMMSSKYRGAIYGQFTNDIDGISKFHNNLKDTEYVMDKNSLLYGKHRSGKEVIPVGDSKQVYHVIDSNDGGMMGYRGLPSEEYVKDVVSAAGQCCYEKKGKGKTVSYPRVIGCPCLSTLHHSLPCTWNHLTEGENGHTMKTCLEIAKARNPYAVDMYSNMKYAVSS